MWEWIATAFFFAISIIFEDEAKRNLSACNLLPQLPRCIAKSCAAAVVAVPVQHKQGIEGCQKQASQASALSQENPSLKPACKSCFGCHKGAALTSGTQ